MIYLEGTSFTLSIISSLRVNMNVWKSFSTIAGVFLFAEVVCCGRWWVAAVRAVDSVRG